METLRTPDDRFANLPDYLTVPHYVTAFSDADLITRGADRSFQAAIPGANGQPHTTIPTGGHFLHEDRGEELAKVVVDFIARSR